MSAVEADTGDPSLVDHLVELYERDNKLTAEQLVGYAADPSSPLHRAFEWDDRIAAHQYRLVQARELLRRAEVVVNERRVRRFVFIPSTSSYHPIESVVRDKDWRAEMVAEFERDAARFAARWENHRYVADNYRKFRNMT